jgi:hypothetical protein
MVLTPEDVMLVHLSPVGGVDHQLQRPEVRDLDVF